MSISARIFLPKDAQPIGPGGHDDAAILCEVERTCADLGLNAPNVAPKDAIRIIATTGRRLMDASRHADCLRLSASAPRPLRDRAPLVMQRIHCLRALDDWPALIGETDRLFARPDPDEQLDKHLSAFVVRSGIAWVIAPCPRLASRLGPPFPDDPKAFLMDDWPGDLSEIIASPALVTLYEKLTARPQSALRQQRLALGSRLSAKMNALARGFYFSHHGSIDVNPSRMESFEKLNQWLETELVDVDLQPLLEAVLQGRNVILLRAHAGIVPHSLGMEALGVPLVLIGRDTPILPGWRYLNTTSDDTRTFEFLKLSKSLRKTQQLVMVYPDGPDGSDFLYIPFRGHQLRIALGPAWLASQRDSQFFFLAGHIEKDHIRAEFRPGPCVGPDMPREVLQQVYVDFFKTNFETILDGDPIELGAMTMLSSVLPVDA